MERPPEQPRINSWRQGLEQSALSPEQLAVLDQMIADGEAENREAAATMLDWQDAIINKPEHMYGL